MGKLSNNIWALGVVSLLTDLGSEKPTQFYLFIS